MPLLIGSRRALLSVPSPVVFASDDFTDTAAALLQNHTPSSGGLWIKHGSATQDVEISSLGRARHANAGGAGIYYHDAVPPSANYRVGCAVIIRSDNNLSAAGPAGRIQAGANTLYTSRYNTNGNLWQIIKVLAGVISVVAQVVDVPVVDQPYWCELDMDGDALALVLNGVAILTGIDADIPDAGFAGIRTSLATTDTTGVHLDTWRAESA